MINGLLNIGITLIIKIPLAIFLIWIGGVFFNSWFGGPTWMWMIILSLVGIVAVKEDLDKMKLKQQNPANQE